MHCIMRVGWSCALSAAFVLGGCASLGDDEPDFHGAESEPALNASKADGNATVGSYVTSTCTTSSVLGLSLQVAAEVACMAPGALAHFAPGDGISFSGGAVLPYLAAGAIADLRVAARRAGRTIEVISGFRTVVQQYLLSRWHDLRRCSIPAAASPGRSNHESGRAVDVGNWSLVKSSLERSGWAEDVPGDDAHFEHLSSPDIRGKDVRAFQRLWNRNHPHDRIVEDGLYGPQTASRIAASPSGGFAIGACR